MLAHAMTFASPTSIFTPTSTPAHSIMGLSMFVLAITGLIGRKETQRRLVAIGVCSQLPAATSWSRDVSRSPGLQLFSLDRMVFQLQTDLIKSAGVLAETMIGLFRFLQLLLEVAGRFDLQPAW